MNIQHWLALKIASAKNLRRDQRCWIVNLLALSSLPFITIFIYNKGQQALVSQSRSFHLMTRNRVDSFTAIHPVAKGETISQITVSHLETKAFWPRVNQILADNDLDRVSATKIIPGDTIVITLDNDADYKLTPCPKCQVLMPGDPPPARWTGRCW